MNSLSPDGDPAEEPTPSQMEQVMDMMQTAVDTANSVRKDADNGVFKGEKGDTGPQGPQGPQGEKGDSGKVDYLTVSEGVLCAVFEEEEI